MAFTIKLKRNLQSGVVPTTTQIEQGELALNLADRKIFFSDGTNVQQVLGHFTGATAPTNPVPQRGDLWYDTNNSLLRVYNGTTFVSLIASGEVSSNIEQLANVTTSGLANGNVFVYNSAQSKWINATSVPKAGQLNIARAIALAGDVTGTVDFDGSGDVTLTTVIADDSHNHTIANIDSLQTSLDAKLNANAVSSFMLAVLNDTGVAEVRSSLGLADVASTGAYANLTGTPTISTVGTSGAYADLTGKPTLVTSLDGLSDAGVSGASTGQVLRHNGSAFVNAQLAYSDISGTPTNISTFTNDANYLTTAGGTVTNLVVSGDLTINGTTTTVNTEEINLADNKILLNSNYSGGSPSEDTGIEINRGSLANKTLIWDEANDKWTVGSETFVAGTFEGALTGEASLATALATARNIALTGDVTGTVAFDGSGSVSMTTTVVDDSHNHTIANVDGLQSALNAKVSSSTISTFGASLIDDVTASSARTTLGLATVANSGSYSNLSDTPSNVSTFTNDSGYLTSSSNIASATKLATARAITLSGDMTGTVNFDGTQDVTITTVIQDDSHSHIISNIDGLQTALDAKLASSSVTSFALTLLDDGNVSTMRTTLGLQTVASSGSYNDLFNKPTNISTADALSTARSITLAGDITGSTTFDGSNSVTITTTIADDSHNHIIGNVDGLQSALDAKVASSTVSTYGATLIDDADATTARTTLGLATVASSGSYNDLSNKPTNLATSSALATARDIALTGDVTGTVSFDGSQDVSITTTIADDSHNHTIANVDGLQTALTAKVETSTVSSFGASLIDDANAGTARTTLGLATIASSGAYSDLSGTPTNIATATTLQTSRTISLAGDVTGSVGFNGSADVSITATIADDSHNHTIANVDGLQTAIDAKFASAGGTVSGNLVVSGNLTVSGTTTTVNTETVNIADNQIVLNSNYTGSSPSENGGIEIERGTQTNKTLVWNETDDKWTVGSETFVAGTFEGNLTGAVTGNASTATTAGSLTTARAIALTGDVSGTANFDGSAGISISTTIADDSHNHTIANVDGLQSALDAKLASSGVSTYGATLIDDADASTARTTLGLGTISTQASNSVAITGGSLSNLSALEVDGGLIELKTNSGNVAQIDMYCETNNAHKVSVKAPAHANYSGNVVSTLPTVTGNLLSHANNLSDLANAGTARTNLGLAIGSNVQAHDANLTTFLGYATLPTSDGSANHILKTNGSGTLSWTAQTSGGGSGDLVASNNLSDVASASTARANLDVDQAGTAVAMAIALG